MLQKLIFYLARFEPLKLHKMIIKYNIKPARDFHQKENTITGFIYCKLKATWIPSTLKMVSNMKRCESFQIFSK